MLAILFLKKRKNDRIGGRASGRVQCDGERKTHNCLHIPQGEPIPPISFLFPTFFISSRHSWFELIQTTTD